MVLIRRIVWGSGNCTCMFVIECDADVTGVEDKLRDPRSFKGILPQTRSPTGGRRFTTKCPEHNSLDDVAAYMACRGEGDVVGEAIRALVAENPNVRETIQTREGPVTRYLDGVDPIIEVISWSAPDGDSGRRSPTMRLNRRFRPGVVTRQQMRNVRGRVQTKYPQADVTEDGAA